MSLIQEALRRQQEEMDDNDGAQAAGKGRPKAPEPAPTDPPTIAKKADVGGTAPNMDSSAPPPVQQPPQMEEDKPPPPPPEALEQDDDAPPPPPPGAKQGKDKSGLKVAMMILAVVVCLGVGIWAVSFGIQHFMGPSLPDPTDNPPAVEAPPPAVEEPAAEPPVEPVEPEPVEPVEPEPVPDNGTVEAPPPVQPPALVKEPVVWPILTINGFVGKGDSGAVIIDGSIVGVNETVMGVKVINIQKSGVTLSYKGETKVVRKDQTTE